MGQRCAPVCWYWVSWVWCCTPIVLLLWGRVVWRQHLEVSGCSPRSILGLCPGWWAAILNVYTVLEKWAFESLVPQPEPSPTLHAWGVRSGASWLQRKVSGCWVLDTPGGGNPWSKATLAHSCVGWGLARQDCCLLSVVTGPGVTAGTSGLHLLVQPSWTLGTPGLHPLHFRSSLATQLRREDGETAHPGAGRLMQRLLHPAGGPQRSLFPPQPRITVRQHTQLFT